MADTLPVTADSAEESLLDPNGDSLGDGENPDWTYDPNEPRYCLCNQVSYGDMVACDNEDVSTFDFKKIPLSLLLQVSIVSVYQIHLLLCY